jgi:sortase A
VSQTSSSGKHGDPDDIARGGVTVTEPSAFPGQADSHVELSVEVASESTAEEEPQAESDEAEVGTSSEEATVDLAPASAKPAKVRKPRRPPSPAIAIYGAAVSIVAVLLLGFVADLSVVGSLHHDRDQRIAYAQLRFELAKGTAPIGPLDSLGHPVAMGDPLALLEIPQIGLTEVVSEGTTAGVLEKGVGHARSSVLPGQVGTSVLMGRRAAFGGPFRDLALLRKGQQFTVTTGQAKSTFRVLDVRHAGDPIPAAPAAGAGRLQLITATGPMYRPTGVVRVDADLVTAVQGAPTLTVNIAPLLKAEYPLQGDPSVLMPLVLWAQALLIAAALVAWARVRWGFWQSWIVGVPLLSMLGLAVADRVAQLLPNLM